MTCDMAGSRRHEGVSEFDFKLFALKCKTLEKLLLMLDSLYTHYAKQSGEIFRF